jgi:DNA invertase Pin-like site-specific DNA recombinase
MMTRRILAYARVSSEDQARGSSLQDQQNAIAAYAKGIGCKVWRSYVEAESAVHEKIERREQIRALMAEVRSGDLVVVDKLDRWSRDAEFSYGSIRRILEAGASFYSVAESLDPSTREGDTALGFRILFAREEAKRIKERMVGTRRLLRDRGYYCEGLPPYGYRRAHPKGHKGAEKNILVVDAKEADTVRRIFRLCVAGTSLQKIADTVELKRDRVHDVLHSRVFLGEILNTRGTWIKALHPAIVDADTFTRAQAAIASRLLGGARPRGTPSETSDWILRDVAKCAHCGATMGAAYAGPLDARRYYFKCLKRCTSRYVPVRAVELEANSAIVARLEALREELGREPKRPPVKPAEDFAGRRVKLQKKRERFLEAFGDDLMTRDELRAAMAKLDADTLKIDSAEQAAKKTNPIDEPEVRRSTLRRVRAIRLAWSKATPAERRAIVGHLATAAKIAAGEPCSFVWRDVGELSREGG